MLKSCFIFFSLIFLIYLLIPGPSSIKSLAPFPNSTKSTLEGDTVQVPNVVAYFSNNYRDFATGFYYQNFQDKPLIPLPLIKLNYPPEFAYTAIKDQTESTYLEEYISPLRSSLFVNGYEPFYEDGQPKFWRSTIFEIDGKNYQTKVTLRFYPSSVLVRLLVWLGIMASVILLFKAGKKVLVNG